MTIQAQLADGRVLEFPDGTDPSIVDKTVQNLLNEANTTERTWSEAASDKFQAVKEGVGNLLKTPGSIYGATTGSFKDKDFFDTGLYGIGKRLVESAEEGKSASLKKAEAGIRKRVEEADKEGFFSGAGQQIKELATDPDQFSSFLISQTIEQLPMIILARFPFIGTAAIAEIKGATLAAKAAEKVGNIAAKEAAEKAIQKIVSTAGTRQAIGAGAVLQGADIAEGSFKELYDGLIDKGLSHEEASAKAVDAARSAGLPAAAISVLVNSFVPGANAMEKAIAGRTVGKVGRLRAAAGIGLKEGTTEVLEEAPGKALQNREYQAVDPNRSIMEGTGSTAGQAFMGGFGMGAGVGAIHGNPHAEASKPSEESLKFEKERLERTAQIEAENKGKEVAPVAIAAPETVETTLPPATQENKVLALPAPSQKIAPVDEDGVTYDHYKAVLDALKKEDLSGLKPAEIHAKIQDILKDSYGTQTPQAVEAKPQEPQAPAATIDIPTAPVKPVKQARPDGWHKDEAAVRQIAESLNIPTTVDQQVQGKPTVKATTRPYDPAAIINILTDAQNGAAKSDHGDVGAVKSMISLGRLTDKGKLTEKGANLLQQLQNTQEPEQIILDHLGMTATRTEVPGATQTVKAPVPAAQLIKAIKAADIAAHEQTKQSYTAEKAAYDAAIKQAKTQTAEQNAAAKAAAAQAKVEAQAAEAKAKAEADALNLRKAADATTILNRASREGHFAPASEKAPAGFEIKRELFKTGEEPGEFNITDGTQNIPFKGTLDEAKEKLARLQAIRDKVAGKLEQEVDSHIRPVQQAQDRIDTLEAMGQHGSEAHAQAVADLEVAKQKAKANAFTSENKLAEVKEPFRLEETGKRPTTREAHTVYHNGEEKGTFPDRKAAEDHVLDLAPEEDLKGMIDSKHSWADRAADALNRRNPDYVAPRTVDNNTPIVETPARPETEDKTDLPPAAGDQIREARIAELTKLLSPILQKMGLGNVTLKIVGAIENNADASYAASVIKMAMSSQNPIRDLKHETIHALKDLGFFTPQQWEALVRQAKNTWINTYLKGVVHDETQTRYDAYKAMGLSEEEIIEEAIADAFADFDANKAPPGMIAALIKRLNQFFASIKSALTGAGWESADQIFTRAEKGDLRSSKENVSQDVSQTEKMSLKYPLAEKGTRYEESDIEPTNMTPDEFLKKVRPLKIDEASRDNIESLKEHIKAGRKLDPLNIYADGKEDGRHRAVAAKELGIKQVPVIEHGKEKLSIRKMSTKEDVIADGIDRYAKALAKHLYDPVYGGVGDAGGRGLNALYKVQDGIEQRLKDVGVQERGPSGKPHDGELQQIWNDVIEPKARKLAKQLKELPREKLSLRGDGFESRYKPTEEDKKEAATFEKENGIKPYVPEPITGVPVKEKYSFKMDDKYGFDPLTFLPLNEDNTVTMYYHTTKQNALAFSRNKVIPSNGKPRLYFTEEANGGEIVSNRGNMDQELDGSVILLNLDPSILQFDMQHDTGRMDFYVSMTEGEFYEKKMIMKAIQASRKKAILESFNYSEFANRISESLNNYRSMNASEKKKALAAARKILRDQHNVGTLLTENKKLEKTRVGDYGLKYEGSSIASMGLGLASAQQITDKMSTCPRSAICEGLCLGETSGGNFLYGGAAEREIAGVESSAFRGGPRMMQYLKTEAMLVNPEAFAILLDAEIKSLRDWCAKPYVFKKNQETGKRERVEKEIYSPAVRLNVTSDFRPEIWKSLMDLNPDVDFYDYTKLGSEPVSKRHHLTYSSTGFSQVVDGERVINPDSNWREMRRRLDNGQNVAMAFSTRDVMPKYLYDEETKKKYQVWNGDNYDARFLDPKKGENGNEFGKGMIIGLTNKDANTNRNRDLEKTAAKKYEGFFVDYDPKSKSKTVIVPDQSKFADDVANLNKEKRRVRDEARASEAQPVAMPTSRKEKLSLRSGRDAFNQEELAKQSETGYKSRYKLIDMKIDDFLSLANNDYDKQKIAEAKDRLKRGIKYHTLPYLYIDYVDGSKGKQNFVSNHEGRSRAIALRDAGYETMPVQLRSYIRWSEQADPENFDYEKNWPETLRAQDKAKNPNLTIPFPVSREEAADDYKPSEKYSLRSQTNTPEFKRWFKDSKVVDADGKPLVVYHKTDEDFSVFDGSKHGKNDYGYAGKGFYFMPFPLQGYTYGNTTMPVYLSLQNPYIRNDENWRSELDPYSWIPANQESLGGKDKAAAAWTKMMQDKGFDGFMDKTGNGDGEITAFNPNQIKSSIGNNGQFDGTNPDIRYSLKSRISPAAFAAVDKTTFAREDKGHAGRMIEALSPRSASWFRQHFIHNFEAIGKNAKLAAAQTGNLNSLLADQSAEAAALMSKKANVIAAEALGVGGREGGIPQYKDGYFSVQENTKGAVEIFAPLMELGKGDPLIYQYYQFWAGAKRGTRFDMEGREHNYTQTDFQYAQEIEKKFPAFDKIQKEWTVYNNGLVKMMQDAGVLTKEAAAEFTKYGDYLPFYRQVDGEATVGPKIFSSIAGAKPPKKLKGSEAPIADFLETIVRNTQASIETSMKNVAGVRAMRDAEILGSGRVDPQATGYNAVTVRIDGIDTKYRVDDPMLVEALKGLNAADMPGLAFFAAPANILRSMVTKDPGFMLANMMRDSVASWVTTGAKVMPIASTIKNFTTEIAGLNPLTAKLRRAGLGGGYDLAGDIESSGREMGKAIRKVAKQKTSMEKAATPFTGIWAALEHGSNASEMATRAAVYEATLKRTGNEAEAIYQAMEVLNFDRRGSSPIIRVLTAVVPFLNARMQGLDLLYRAGSGNLNTENAKQVQRNFMVRSAVIFALTAMYWALTHDDDDYLAQEQQTRDDNWLVPRLGIKIPIPFELGILFKVIPERILEYYFGKDTGKDFADSMTRAATSTMSVNLPQIMLPVVENITNHSFFTGRPIVPRALENLDPTQQRDPYTSGIAKRLGDATGLSPMKIDHLISGYFGTFGGYAATLTNAVFDGNDPSRASLRPEQMPFFKRFMLDKNAKGAVTEFYELQHETDAMVRTINILERDGRFDELAEYQQGHLSTLATKEYVLALNKTMKELNGMDRMIRNSSLSPDEKRDIILSLTQQKNAVTSYIRDLRKQMSKTF